MISLYRKEIQGFFSNLTGYIVIIIFLLANSVVMWLYPGKMNILDAGYASIDSMFITAPWIFLFLVPALTMRTFAEEQQSGTLGLLLSRPLTGMQIVISKYLASVTLLLFSLLPCLIYFLSVFLLGNPRGNIDTGGTWGSLIGLFFLGAVYASIGVLSSSLTDNLLFALYVWRALISTSPLSRGAFAGLQLVEHFDHPDLCFRYLACHSTDLFALNVPL